MIVPKMPHFDSVSHGKIIVIWSKGYKQCSVFINKPTSDQMGECVVNLEKIETLALND